MYKMSYDHGMARMKDPNTSTVTDNGNGCYLMHPSVLWLTRQPVHG